MKLILDNGKFIVISIDNKKRFEFFNAKDAVRKLEDLGVGYFSIEDALVDMNSKKHNTAHFGINGTFIFSE